MKGVEKSTKPNISALPFWDVKYEELDYENDRFFIIEKVLNYGLWNDFIELLRFYGKDTIKQEIVKSAYLKKDVLNFVCTFFDLQPNQFTCYNRRQLSQALWDF